MLHLKKPTYGASGHGWAEYIKTLGYTDILDFGCGKGTLGKALGFPIKEYDPAIPGKNTAPEPADLVVCTDVLEHVEPEYLENLLSALHYVTKKKAFFVIATRPANKTLKDGRNAHLIVEPAAWWKRRIGRYFKIDNCKEGVNDEADFVLLCSPKDVELRP